MNGTTPVPGPTMIIGISGLYGILKALDLINAFTVVPAKFDSLRS